MVLIAYYSRAGENYFAGALKRIDKGNTERVAEIIARLTGGELFHIEQEESYPESYNDCINEAEADQRAGRRPRLERLPESIDRYDAVYLGYPNYWGTMPMAVFTFLESFDFSGRRIYPFCTHEGSGLGHSIEDIRALCPDAIVDAGFAVTGTKAGEAEPQLRRWLGL